MTNYLVATDLSPRSDAALKRALAILRSTPDARLTVLHVHSDDLPFDLAAEEGRFTLRALQAGLHAAGATDADQISARSVGGDAHVAIHEAAEELDAALILVGIPRARRFPANLSGTTAERLLGLSDRPVAVVRYAGRDWRRVLFALDEGGESLAAFDRVKAMGLLDQAEVTVLHATNLPAPAMIRGGLTNLVDLQRLDMLALSEIEQNLRTRLVTRLAGPKALRFVVRHGAPSTAIREQMLDDDYDLLLLGSHGRGPLIASLLGSTSAEMIRDAGTDLICVPLGEAKA